jgi:hypothetical protein
MQLCLSVLLCTLASAALGVDAEPTTLLSPELGLAADARALRQGRIVARVLEAADGAEVVTIAAVHVNATSEGFSACALQPSCLLGHDELHVAARVSAASAETDLAGFSLDPHDRQQLERCRVGKCSVRLSAAAIERFRSAVDWKGRDATLQATQLFRQMLAAVVRGYADSGDSALPAYEDDGRRVSVAQALATLFSRPLPPLALAPGLLQHMQGFPTAPLATGQEYLCWRQERFWLQSLVTLEHVALQPTAAGQLIVAVKQLYASHYFEAALTVFAFEPDPAGGGLLLEMSRVRADIRPSGFTWLERVLLNHLVRGRLVRHLDTLRTRLARPQPAGRLAAPAS